MSPHAAPHELHDYVYGFVAPERRDVLRAHLSECGTCRDATDRLQDERSALAGAFSETEAPDDGDIADLKRKVRAMAPARRTAAAPWSRWIPLAAAAAVIAALGVWLIRPARPDVSGSLPGQQSADEPPSAPRYDLRRLVTLAESARGPESDLALLALQTGGSAGNEALHDLLKRRPQLATRLPGGYKHGTDEASKAVLEKLDAIRIDTAFSGSPLTDVVDFIREVSGLNIVIDSKVILSEVPKVDVTVANKPLTDVINQVTKSAGCGWAVEDGVVVLAPLRVRPMSFALLRTPCWPAQVKAAEKAIAQLGVESLSQRDAAAQELARLGPAAEDALWKGLDSRDAQVRQQAQALLKRLYTEPPARPPGADSEKLRKILGRPIDVDGMNLPVEEVLAMTDEDPPLNWVLLEPSFEVSIKVRQIKIEQLLELILGTKSMKAVPVGDLVFLADRERVAAPPAGGAVWAPIEIADEIRQALENVARGKEVDLARLGPPALYALEAMAAAKPELKARAESLRNALGARYVFPDTRRFADTVSDPKLRAALTSKATLKLSNQSPGAEIEALARKADLPLRCDGLAKAEVSLSLTDVPLGTILEAVALATGRSLKLDGGAVVLSPAK